MTKPLIDLAERAEAATGHDVLELINLEADICAALGIDPGSHEAPFTASLDAALTLVPEGLELVLKMQTGCWRAIVWPHGRTVGLDGNACTPALALVAAALRARSSQ